MAARTRNTNVWSPQGSWKSTLGEVHTDADGRKRTGYDNCTDQTGPGDCLPFLVESWECSGGVLNGKGSGGRSFTNWLGDGLDPANFNHLTINGLSADGTYALQAMARTNPSRAYVDVPIELLQLGDIPKLIRDAGRSIIKKAASANIKTQFGILPLADDLAKLVHFTNQVDRRVADFIKLSSPKGYRRTLKIDAKAVRATKSVTFQSENALLSGTCTGHSYALIRAHVRWRSTIDMRKYRCNLQLRKLAKKAVLGMTVDWSTAWELIPWSWLIDWGYNLSQFFAATRNLVPATLTGIWLSKHTKTVWTCPQLSTGTGITMSSFRSVRETKRRQAVNPTTIAHFPFLSGKQMGILGSLYVLRRR